MRTLLTILLLSSVAFGQSFGGGKSFSGGKGFRGGGKSSILPIAADGSPCSVDNGATSATTVACTLTVPTSGDTVVCGYLSNDGGGNVPASVSDGTNGFYRMAKADNTGGVGWQNVAYFANAAAGTYAITGTSALSKTNAVIECQSFKRTRTTSVVDGTAISGLVQVTSGANPTAGTATLPNGSGELIIGTLNSITNTPTAGSGYTLFGSATTSLFFSEYSIQTTATATNCPYVMSSDVWGDNCLALLPSTAAAGVEPLTGIFIDFEGGTNGSAPTTTTLTNSTHLSAGGIWGSCTNTHSSMTYATAGQLHNFVNNVWLAGTSYNGSGTLGFQYATGTGGDNCLYTFGNNYPLVSMSFWFETSIPASENSTQYSMNTIGTTSTEQCDPYIITNGSQLAIGVEHHGGQSTNNGVQINISSNTVYQIQVDWVPSTACTVRIFDTSGNEISGSPIACDNSADICGTTVGSGNGNQLEIGITGAEAEASGHNIWYDDLRYDTLGTFPQPR